MHIKTTLFLSALLLFSELILGQEQEWLFDTARVLGRGRTFVAAPDSDHAGKLNPATLGEADVTFQLRFFDAEALLISDSTLSTISDLSSASTSEDGIKVLKKFDENFGKRQFFKGQMSFASMRIKNFGISPFGVNRSWLEFQVPPLPEAAWSVDAIYGVNFSMGLEIMDGLSVGVALRPMKRHYIAGKVAFVDIVEWINPDQVAFDDYAVILQGSGTGADIGLIAQPGDNFRAGLTIRNVGDTAFNTESNPGEHKIPAIRQNISLGLMNRSDLNSWLHLDQYLDIHSLMNRDGLSFFRLLSLGAELGSSVFSRDHDYGVLLGLSEGYLSAGIFADLFFLRLEAVSYGVEMGHNPGQEQDRRWGLSARSTMTF